MTTLAVGGAERSLLEILKRIDRTRIEPIVCSLISGGRLRRSFEDLGIPVVELGVKPGMAEWRGLLLARLLARYRPDIVHSRLILSNLWARLGYFAGAKVICEERVMDYDRPQFMTWLTRLSAPLCTMTTANSRLVAEHVERRDRTVHDRLRLIYGGVDLRRFFPRTNSLEPPFTLVCVARLEKQKGVSDLIQAMERVVSGVPGTRLSIVGGGNERHKLETMVVGRGLASSVVFQGEQLDIPDQLRHAKVFVTAGLDEGLPNTVLEAMACGLPVVATDVGGTREQVVHGQTGFLVPPGDPDSLANAIREYLTHPHLMTAHGAAGRRVVEQKFDIEATVRAYENLYAELLG